VVVAVGFRRTFWSAATGFELNDRPLKIKGSANHQDHAGVGVAVPDVLQLHRIAKLKEMGMNAWRTAHNAPSPALLDAADRLGFLVWDENHRNGQFDEIRRLVLRDRNHPSVFIWSVCNEMLCETANIPADFAQSVALFKELDPKGGRVVSANYNGANGPTTVLDVQGVDYQTETYDAVHVRAPLIPCISSESSSAVSDRGETRSDAGTAHVTGYDTMYPSWGESTQAAWGGIGMPAGQGILTRPFMAGGFTWTGWDYKGEPVPYGWPNINSHFGIIDMAGFPKDRFFWYKAWLRGSNGGVGGGDSGVMHLIPQHWNWPPGTTVAVWAYTDAASAELFVDGVSQGRKPQAAYSHLAWPNTTFSAPGTLRAVGYDAAGNTVSEEQISTTGPAARLRATIKDRVGSGGLQLGCDDLALVQVEVLDAEGRLVTWHAPNFSASGAGGTSGGNVVVTFHVDGGGGGGSGGGGAAYVGGGNGDPSCHAPDQSPTRPTFHGLALGIVRAPVLPATAGRRHRTGAPYGRSVAVRVTSPGLEMSTLEIPMLTGAREPTRGAVKQEEWWCHRSDRQL
jgi:beta-galactosidase